MTNERFTEIGKAVFKEGKRFTLSNKEFNEFLNECRCFVVFPNIVVLHVSANGNVTFREL